MAGLVTGGDILKQLKGRVGDHLLIPDVMLRHDGACFLDDITPDEVSVGLGVPLTVVGGDGQALVDALML